MDETKQTSPMPPAQPVPPPRPSPAGPVVGIILIIIVLIIGALYFWGGQLNRNAPTPNAPTQSIGTLQNASSTGASR